MCFKRGCCCGLGWSSKRSRRKPRHRVCLGIHRAENTVGLESTKWTDPMHGSNFVGTMFQSLLILSIGHGEKTQLSGQKERIHRCAGTAQVIRFIQWQKSWRFGQFGRPLKIKCCKTIDFPRIRSYRKGSKRPQNWDAFSRLDPSQKMWSVQWLFLWNLRLNYTVLLNCGFVDAPSKSYGFVPYHSSIALEDNHSISTGDLPTVL